MKKFIYNINQYLLERYPTVWNTKIVWVLLASFAVHILFFLFGFFTLTNPELLQENGADQLFFENGTLFFSVLISILLLVVWLINMFKNNAFKDFYPMSRWNLFLQFVFYLMIVFCSTTFYYSYNFGMKTYISNTYTDARVEKEISTSNTAAVFFSHDIGNYTLDQLHYPKELSNLYCETREGFTDVKKPYFEFLDFKYQYYSLYTKEKSLSEIYLDTSLNGYIYSKRTETKEIYYYRDTVVDVSKYVKTATPSYYNYSGVFYANSIRSNYDFMPNLTDYNTEYYYDPTNWFSETAAISSQNVHDLLVRNDPKEIKKLLSGFLEIANTYKIRHNIDSAEWYEIIYHPTAFEVMALINNQPPLNYQFATEEQTALEKFNTEHITKYYIETQNLHNVFENIHEIKTAPIFGETLHVFIWLAFFIASVVFVFRISGLRSLLFTIISIGVLSIFVALVTAVFSYANLDSNGDEIAFFFCYFTLILSTVIILIPLYFASKLKKQLVGICLNMTISGFVLYVFLIVGIISLHQEHYCSTFSYATDHYEDCFVLIKSVGFYLSYILLAIGILFMYFYAAIIKKWKALPEG